MGAGCQAVPPFGAGSQNIQGTYNSFAGWQEPFRLLLFGVKTFFAKKRNEGSVCPPRGGMGGWLLDQPLPHSAERLQVSPF